MTRRNQRRFSQKKLNNNEKHLVKMLDMRKLSYFRYDVKEIFNSTEIEQKVWNPMLASIVTKASRLSIEEANVYIHELEDEGILGKETAKAISQLLDRYKRWR
jgi:hypothetical protein